MARRNDMAVREEDATKTPTIYMALDLGRRRWTVGVCARTMTIRTERWRLKNCRRNARYQTSRPDLASPGNVSLTRVRRLARALIPPT
jgi:hypothetical protein